MLLNKFSIFGGLGLDNKSLIKFIVNLQNIDEMTNEDLLSIYECNINFDRMTSIDE